MSDTPFINAIFFNNFLSNKLQYFLPIKSFPFPVDTNKFTPGTDERKNVLIYFKKRGPEKERLVYEKLNSMNETYKMFRYGFYEEEEYLKAINIFFSLKRSYETKVKNDRKKIKKKAVNKGDYKTMIKNYQPKCVNCKGLGGTIFKINSGYYVAECNSDN